MTQLRLARSEVRDTHQPLSAKQVLRAITHQKRSEAR